MKFALPVLKLLAVAVISSLVGAAIDRVGSKVLAPVPATPELNGEEA